MGLEVGFVGKYLVEDEVSGGLSALLQERKSDGSERKCQCKNG